MRPGVGAQLDFEALDRFRKEQLTYWGFQLQDQANRVFILSLDGATFDVLGPLVRQGYMPNLGRVLDSGLSAELESVIPPVTAPAWTSFMTGKNPNKHGIFDFTRFDDIEYKWKLNNSQHIRSKTIWQILSEHGKRIVVLNLPYMYPTYEVNGVIVAGWDAPTTSSFTYPEQVGREIYELIPDYGLGLDLSLWNYLPAESDAEFDQFILRLVRSFEQSAMLASHFLRKQEWDVFMVHFQQTDWIQHKLWRYIERACNDPGDKNPRLERVRECYRSFDRQVGRLLEEVSPLDPIRIILSDHGFGRNYGTICPNYILRELGYYHLKPQADGRVKRSFKDSRHSVVRNMYQTLRAAKDAIQGRKALKKYRSWADMANETIPTQKTNVDWSRTKAGFVTGSEVGFIYINIKGRGPYGLVEPGAEYDQVLAHLIAEFRTLRNGITGEPLFARVVAGSEIYVGAASDIRLPDLVLVPAEGYVVGAGLAQPLLTSDGEKGDHRHNGVLLLQGPGIRTTVTNLHPKLIDLAPTILHSVGVPVPRDMDGKVLEQVFVSSPPIHFETVDNSRFSSGRDYSPKDSDLIEQRLRGLGYVD